MVIPVSFFFSRELRNATPEAIVVYLILRADILTGETEIVKKAKIENKLVSGLDVQTLAQLTAKTEITIIRVLDELLKRKWIERDETYSKLFYRLGYIKEFELRFYLDSFISSTSASKDIKEIPETVGESRPLTPSEVIRKKLEESRLLMSSKREETPKARTLSEATESKLIRTVTDSFEETPIKAKDIIKLFAVKYEKKYGIPCPLITEGEKGAPHATTYVYVGRAIKWSKSAKEVYEVVEFMFEKWDEIKLGLGLDGPPTFNILGSSKLWPRLVCCKTEGIPTPKTKTLVKETITHRFDPSKPAPETGW